MCKFIDYNWFLFLKVKWKNFEIIVRSCSERSICNEYFIFSSLQGQVRDGPEMQREVERPPVGGEIFAEEAQGPGAEGRGPPRGSGAGRRGPLSTTRVPAPGLRDQHGDGPRSGTVSTSRGIFRSSWLHPPRTTNLIVLVNEGLPAVNCKWCSTGTRYPRRGKSRDFSGRYSTG